MVLLWHFAYQLFATSALSIVTDMHKNLGSFLHLHTFAFSMLCHGTSEIRLTPITKLQPGGPVNVFLCRVLLSLSQLLHLIFRRFAEASVTPMHLDEMQECGKARVTHGTLSWMFTNALIQKRRLVQKFVQLCSNNRHMYTTPNTVDTNNTNRVQS